MDSDNHPDSAESRATAPGSGASFREPLAAAYDAAIDYLDGLPAAPVNATAQTGELRARLGKPLGPGGLPAGQVITQLIEDVRGGLIGSAGGRFFAWVIGGGLPAAVAADWLTAVWDQNAALHASGPAAAIVEEVAGAWLKDILGIPAAASFAFVTGCQMAHVTCLAAARHALLARAGWDLEDRGMSGAPEITIIAGDQFHGSVSRAIRLLGFGRSQVVSLPVDQSGALSAASLAKALNDRPGSPVIVALQAGDVNTGAFDPFAELIPLCKRQGAWVHVDGAFGLWANASPAYRRLLSGAEAADSWATDGHKTLNVPFDCGYAFVADPEAHRASMSHQAPYLIRQSDTRDAMDWTPEWSRRARAFPTYAALRELGRSGIAAVVENCCAHARALTLGIGKLKGAEVLCEPVINQGLVRFLDPRPQATDADHDRRTGEVIAAISSAGGAFFGGTTWRGRRAMRISVCNWRTTAEDVESTLREVERVLAAWE